MKIKSKIITGFVAEFENKFGKYLKKPKKMDGAVCASYLRLFEGRMKFSDWDLQCFIRKNVTVKIIEEMKSFVRSFEHFESIGEFVTGSKKYLHIGQHLHKTTHIQFMGFMPKEKFAPFMDFTIFDVENKLVRKLYQPQFDDEFLVWAILTAWRKLKNGNREGFNSYNHIVSLYVLPHFSKKNQKEIDKNPQRFFKEFLKGKGYDQVAKFLAFVH